MTFVLTLDLEPDPQTLAYEKMRARNARPHCETCNAFVSKEQARRTGGFDYWGEWYGPFCEKGKGCNK